MKQSRFFWVVLGLAAFVHVSPCTAQTPSPREELLRLVPPDNGFCLILNDLRGKSAKILDASWLKALRNSTIGQTLAASPEAQRLAQFENSLQKNVQIDWPFLRDEVLGDMVVFAYRPPPPGQPTEEQGLLLLWARKPDLLAQAINRLNQAQKKVKELNELVPIEYQGRKYFRRIEAAKTNFYLLEGSLLAFSSQENLIRGVIDQRQKPAIAPGPTTLARQLEKAGADRALLTLWLNPRAFDADLQQKTKSAPAPLARVMETFLTYWHALEAAILSVNLDNNLEIKVSFQVRPQDLPKAIRPLFTAKAVPSELWSRFPADAIFRFAGRFDAVALTEAMADFTPPPARQTIADAIQRQVGAALGLDLAKDVLPNLGPDWGLCVAPGPAQHDVPLVLAALAVRPGNKEVAVDQALVRAFQMVVALGVIGYNSAHAEPINIKTVMHDKVEVKYLDNKTFPPGFQPAFALKDGFFVLASSPDAIRRFQKINPPAFASEETPLLHLSLRKLTKFLKDRHEKVSAFLAEKNHISREAAGQFLDGLVGACDLFDHVLLTERRDAAQVTWSLRLRSSK